MARASAVLACMRLHASAFGRDGWPLLLASASAGVVVLGGAGLDPRDVADLMGRAPLVRLGVAVGWAVLTRSAVRRQLFPPGAVFVRCSPVPRSTQWAISSLFVLACELGPAALVAAGGAFAQALLLAFAECNLALASRRSWVAAAIAVAVLALPLSGVAAGGGACALMLCSALALRREHRALHSAPRRSLRLAVLPAIAHLVLAQLRTLARTRPAALLQGAIVGVLGWAWLRRWIAEQPRGESAPVLDVAAVVALLSTAPIAGSVVRVHRALLPWIRATVTPRKLGLLAAVLVLGAPSMAFAASLGALPGGSLRGSSAVGAAAYALAICAVTFRVQTRLHAVRRDARALQVAYVIAALVLAVSLAHAPGWLVVAATAAAVSGVALGRERESFPC